MSKLKKKWIDLTWATGLTASDLLYSISQSITSRLNNIKDPDDDSILIDSIAHPTAEPLRNKLYSYDGEFYILDTAGNKVQITKDGVLALLEGANIILTKTGSTGEQVITIDLDPDATFDSIRFNSTATPTWSPRTMAWDSDISNVALNLTTDVNVDIGRQLLIKAYNNTGASLVAGTPVSLAGVVASKIHVNKTDITNTVSATNYMGLVVHTFSSGQEGYVILTGKLYNMNTSLFNEENHLYIGNTAGTLTIIEPTLPNYKIDIGIVEKRGTSDGVIFVHQSTFPKLSNLSDILITTPLTGHYLRFDGTKWINQAGSGGGGDSALSDLTDVVISSPINEQLLSYDSTSHVWINKTISSGTGSGTISGPLVSTDHAIVIWDTTSAIKIQNSLATIDSTGSINIPSGQAYKINGVNINAVSETLSNKYINLKAGTTAAGTGPLKFTTGSLLATPESGVVEYVNEKAYFTISEFDGITSSISYPLTIDFNYIMSPNVGGGSAFRIIDPTTNLSSGNVYYNNGTTDRVTVDMGVGNETLVKKLYYENYMYEIAHPYTTYGWKDFTLWGSNSATAWASRNTYISDANMVANQWTQLPTSQSYFDIHTSGTMLDPKYLVVTNTISYRYFSVKITSNWGAAQVGFGRLSFMIPSASSMQPYRKQIILNDGNELTSGKIPVATTYGKLIDSQVSVDSTGSINIPAAQTYKINGSPHTHILDDLSDVTITTPTDRQVLLYDSTSRIWVNGTSSGTGTITGPATSTDNAIVRWDSTGAVSIQNSLVTIDDSGSINVPFMADYQVDGIAHAHQAGPTEEPILTVLDNTGTIRISSFRARIYISTDFTGPAAVFTIPQTDFSCINNAEETLVVDYNSGNPILRKAVTSSEVNGSNIYTVFVVWRQDSTVHSLDVGTYGLGLANKLNRYVMGTTVYSRSINGGLILSETQTPVARTVVVSGATVYKGAMPETIYAFNSSDTTTCLLTQVNHVGSVWTYTHVTQYNNLYYDNGANLVGISGNNNRFANRYFYRSIGDVKEVFYTFGTNDYNNIIAAQLENVPTPPTLLRDHCMLIGRITIMESATSGTVQSSFTTIFAGTDIQNHNDLSNLEGGNLIDEYYHLAAADYSAINTGGTTNQYLRGDKTWQTLTLDSTSVGAEPIIMPGTTSQYWRGDKTWRTHDLDSLTDVAISNPAPKQLLYYDATSHIWANLPDPWYDTAVHTGEPAGFVNRTDSQIAYDSTTGIFTISAKSPVTQFEMYSLGNEYEKISDSLQLPLTDGFYFIYYNSVQALSYLVGPPQYSDFYANVFVATVYRNNTTKKAILADERHGCTMDWASHYLNHSVEGAEYLSGFGLTIDSTSFVLAAGSMMDDDIKYDMTTALTCSIIYNNGSLNIFDWTDNSSKYYYTDGTNIYYNNGATLTPATRDYYVAYWIYSTNCPSKPIMSIMGQRQDALLDDARINNTRSSFTWNSVPTAEIKLLYRVIVKNTVTIPTYIEYDDYRLSSNTPHTHNIWDVRQFSITSPHTRDILVYNGTKWVNSISGDAGVARLYFNPAATRNTWEEGQFFYDYDWKTVSTDLGRDCTLQIGQEEWRRIYNDSTATILNGQPVYTTSTPHLDGSFGNPNVSTVRLACANSSTTYDVLGCATQNIASGQYGMITIRGLINDLDTSSWPSGTELYLSDVTPGALTSSLPSSGNYKIRVGRVIKSATAINGGSLNIRIFTTLKLDDITNVNAATPTTDDILKFNGTEWVNGPSATSSASAGISFYPNDSTTYSVYSAGTTYGVAVLSKTPSSDVETTKIITCATLNNTYLYGAYDYPIALNRTTLDAGTWEFNIYANGSVTGCTIKTNINRLRPGTGTITTIGSSTTRLAMASSGAPFTVSDVDTGTVNQDDTYSYLETSSGIYKMIRLNDSTAQILTAAGYANQNAVSYKVHHKLFQASALMSGTTLALNSFQVVQPQFTLQTTDSISLMFFGMAPSNTRTVSFSYQGSARYSRFMTPLITLHGNLAGLQGGSGSVPNEQYYHLNSAQYTVVGNLATPGSSSQYWRGDETWATIDAPSSGIPAISSSAINAIAVWDSTSGNSLKNTLVTIDSTGSINIPLGASYKMGGISLMPPTVNTNSNTTIILGLSDANTILMTTYTGAGGVNIIVPNDTTALFPIYTEIQILQTGTSNVSISPAAGVSITSLNNYVLLAGKGAAASLLRTNVNTWYLFGALKLI